MTDLAHNGRGKPMLDRESGYVLLVNMYVTCLLKGTTSSLIKHCSRDLWPFPPPPPCSTLIRSKLQAFALFRISPDAVVFKEPGAGMKFVETKDTDREVI
jgi:hypothetical protein